MTPAVGKFDRYPLMRQVSRWEWETAESFTFNDPVHGSITCPPAVRTDLASIRFLREVFRWCAIGALVAPVVTHFAHLPGRVDLFLWAIAALAILCYSALAGYGNRMAAMHDYLYEEQLFPKEECDAILWRMARTGEGMAMPRAALFYAGPWLGGFARYYRWG